MITPLQYECLNVLHARGQDEWTSEEVLKHINEVRSDHPDKLTIRRVTDALSYLIDDEKVTRRQLPRNDKGHFGGYKYRIAPETYTKPNYHDAWESIITTWPYPLIALVVPLVIGLFDIINWIF